MSGFGFLSVFVGAGCGAALRWVFGLWLNPVFPTLPLGTLTANLVGGLMIGISMTYLGHHTALAPEWRLFVITGFLGGLTTFSTFSAEVVTLISRSEYLWALASVGVHLLGSLALTGLGILITGALLARH